MTPGREVSVQVPEARPELTPRPGSRGELDAAPAGAEKRRSFSLTLGLSCRLALGHSH